MSPGTWRGGLRGAEVEDGQRFEDAIIEGIELSFGLIDANSEDQTTKISMWLEAGSRDAARYCVRRSFCLRMANSDGSFSCPSCLPACQPQLSNQRIVLANGALPTCQEVIQGDAGE